jgi:hypothetical protein
MKVLYDEDGRQKVNMHITRELASDARVMFL